MRLRHLFTASAAGLFGVALVTGVALVVLTSWMHRAAVDQVEALEGVRAAMELRTDLLVYQREYRLWALQRSAAQKRAVERAQESVERALSALRAQNPQGPERASVERLASGVETYLQAVRTEMVAPPRPPEPLPEQRELEAALDSARSLVDGNLREAQRTLERVRRWDRLANALGLTVAVLLLGGVVSVLLLIRAYVTRPLLRMQETITRYQPGHGGVVAPESGADELREIGRAFASLSERLENQRERQLEFIAAVGHELRNPLNAMRASAALVLRDAQGGAGTALGERVARIERQVLRLDRLAEELLDTARVEAGRLDLHPASNDLTQLVRDAVSLYQPVSALHQWEVELPAQPIWLTCDAHRVAQVLNNLLNNALKYSPDGGRLRVAVEGAGDEAWVLVEDEGVGIARDELPHIFEPFRRARATRSTIPGVGLGLSVSQRIANAHGGRIEVESTPGVGSRFRLILPKGSPPPGLQASPGTPA
ncbi:MAG: ATP-binding protein [Myxococcaceae bacterium]|nr:ATP-binding protein [Myxococcaceae bacterium]